MGTVTTAHSDRKVEDFLASVQPERRRREGVELLALMNRATGLVPRLWGTSIVGYGRYAYRYDSGLTGQASLTGFSPRKAALTVYIMPGFEPYRDALARLGKHKTSASCLYLASLNLIDREVLSEIVADSVERMKRLHPEWWPE